MGIFEMSHATKKRLHLNPGLSDFKRELRQQEDTHEDEKAVYSLAKIVKIARESKRRK